MGNDTSGRPPTSADEGPPQVPCVNSPHAIAAKSGPQFAGLIAQDVQALFPEMVTQRAGYIDGEPVTELRDLDITPLIYALVNAVNELAARGVALERAAARR